MVSGDRCDFQEGGGSEGHCKAGSVWGFEEMVLQEGNDGA